MDFEFPATLPETAEELNALRQQAVDAFNEIYGDGGNAPSPEELEKMQQIIDGIGQIDAALGDADERLDAAAALADSLNKQEGDDEDDEQDGDKAEEAEEFAADDDTAAEEEGEEADADADESPQEDVTPEEDADDANKVTAEDKADNDDEDKDKDNVKRTDFSKAANGRTPDVPERESGFRLTTSAQNYEDGVVDSLRVAQEFGNLAQGRAARVVGQNGRSETTIAYFDREIPDEFKVSDSADAIRVLDNVTDESRLPGGSLTAAGGWVSPSETSYEFLPTGQASDLLSLPEVSIQRGGIKFPVEPDFSAVYNSIGFHQTEADMLAGVEKPAFEIPGAEFEEVRLDAIGIQITGGILQDKAWPELTRKYVDEAMRLHQHKISANRIQQVVEGSINVGTLTGPQFGTIGAVLNAVELQVADLRVKHRLGSTQSVEGIAPTWLLAVLRSDLAYREGVLPEQVTDAQIRAHFAERGANLQFVSDWQNDVIGGSAAATAWPETVDIVLYPAGTWWGATEPVINLGIVHDSALLKQNRQIQMFTEDGVAVGKRGPESRIVTVPLAVDGTVGARYEAPAEA